MYVQCVLKVGKQEVGIWWVQKRFPWYGVPIWSLWPNIRSQPSIVAEKKYDEKYAYMFNVYKNQLSRQTGSTNLTGPKTLPTIWHTYMKLVTKYQISVINSCWEKCDEKWAYMFNVYKNQVGKQEVGIWCVQKRFPQYGIPIWHLWPNIRFLPSIVTEKNILDGQKDGRTEIKQYTPPPPSGV
jgi:hypothetical protein